MATASLCSWAGWFGNIVAGCSSLRSLSLNETLAGVLFFASPSIFLFIFDYWILHYERTSDCLLIIIIDPDQAFFENFFQEYHQSFKQLESRSG